MKNKPVAWISVLAMDKIGQKFTDVRISLTKTDVADIPLYTHPAKTLTDEEIWDVWADFTNSDGEFTEPEAELLFARAILRKAQEK
jgi:hypothetical protein